MNFPDQEAARVVGDQATGDGSDLVGMLRAMLLIRAFEDRLMRLKSPGFQLLSSGEEGVSAGICAAMEPQDQLLSSGRAIGPALARGLDPRAVMAELQGKATGVCKGRGGRGHLAQPASGFFGAHAVVGGNLTVAAGVALAARMQGPPSAVVCLFGDGACGAGALHETLNIAALWQLPLVLACNNNRYSVSTPAREALAPVRLSDLAGPFGIPARTVDGMDVVAVRDAALAMTARARGGGGPSFLECLSYRFMTHSTPTRETRPTEEIRLWRERCPILKLESSLRSGGILDAASLDRLRREAIDAADEAARWSDASHDPDPTEALADVG